MRLERPRAIIMKIDGALSSVAVGTALTYSRSEIWIIGAKVWTVRHLLRVYLCNCTLMAGEHCHGFEGDDVRCRHRIVKQ